MRYRNITDVSSIGRVVNRPAQFDDEGNKTQDATLKNGHFVVTVEPIPAWDKWRVTNDEPLPRVFAGRQESSTLYQFPSEAAFISAFEPKEDSDAEL